MAKRSWTFDLDPVPAVGDGSSATFLPYKITHHVELVHGYWTNDRTIRLDGQVLPPQRLQSCGRYGIGSDDIFIVDGHECRVCVRVTRVVGETYTFDLAVDGRSIETGLPIVPWVLPVLEGWSQWLYIPPKLLLGFPLSAIAPLAGVLTAQWAVRIFQTRTGGPLTYGGAILVIIVALLIFMSMGCYLVICHDLEEPLNRRVEQGLFVSGGFALAAFLITIVELALYTFFLAS